MATGPEGGEVRSIASDPQSPGHVFLGTSSGRIFCSNDFGRTWSLCAKLGTAEDYVIDNIAVDLRNSQNVYAAAWNLTNRRRGDLFRSSDGGKNWMIVRAMHGKSIRCMAISPSRPGFLLVGTLDGVFRSKDDGQHWLKISEPREAMKNVESLAIDPKNPDILYVGTWHLAWKTNDGGEHWRRVDKGMIDDSDVFSIIIDQLNPEVVFAAACSGIYKSTDGGGHFERIQGIPFSARRTRVLRQDLRDPSVIYAGTTEGLWVTSDSGGSWKRVTSPGIVVNDIVLGSQDEGRILLATDRAGVLGSDVSRFDFHPSNSGFSHRYISSILVDDKNPDTVYLSVVNDREYGGVFVSSDAGRHWIQDNVGLEARDVFALQRGANGAVLAGTDHGLFVLARNATVWQPSTGLQQLAADGSPQSSSQLKPKINEIQIADGEWLAATSVGFYISKDAEHWFRSPIIKGHEVLIVRRRGDVTVLLDSKGLLFSADSGRRWRRLKALPVQVEAIADFVITGKRNIVLGTRAGLFRSDDLGGHWQRKQRGFPAKDITSFTYNERQERLYAVSGSSKSIFQSDDAGLTWHKGPDSGWSLRQIRTVNGKILAATKFDGVIVNTNVGNDKSSLN